MELLAAFILGFLGSLHCAGMCGPLAAALPATGRTPIGFLVGRLSYNLGRIVTYCLIGLVVGLIGKSLFLAGIQRWLSIVIGALLLTGLLTSRKLSLSLPVVAFVNRLKFLMAEALKRRSLSSMLILGLLNGLLPCGLVYVAAGAATLTGSMMNGIAFMLFFGLGTVPMMFLLGLTQKLFPVSLRLRLLKAVPYSIFVMGVPLILRGLSLGIPYISPILSGASCCGR
jgi:sulfite exporter TauE/SafE